MAEISIQHLTKRYGEDYAAVADVSLDIADGEFMILVGPSGSGKSTLLHMIVGLIDISEGDLYIDGERMNEKAPRDRNLAMVFQNYALYTHLTAYENIAFPLRLRKMPDDEVRQRVDRAASMLELGDYLDRKPANLSGGQRQRVAMGRAIVRDAKAYLFDEPLSNLDAKLRAQMRTDISRMQSELGTTSVYVTHDQVEAMTLGDRLAVLRKGVLQQVGTPRDLYERPVNLFVAGFIGSPPMNLVPAGVQSDSLRTPFGDVPFDSRMLPAGFDDDHLIVGLRPERFRDPATLDEAEHPGSVTFTAHVDVIEWLGDEQLLYVPFEAPERIARQLVELGQELDVENPRTQLTVQFSAETSVAEGSDIQLAVDRRDLHYFDPRTGSALTPEPLPQAA
ncbi:MAG TPA: sn-glycerol-3-phosphate ABC transporter ATP-binding protein UgpC [Gaiellaceae bacterium]|nr:sn-glycerol-3-phosphate ABC transporter ATP-binding protein UgpC [Gaiellaceae bacterium]